MSKIGGGPGSALEGDSPIEFNVPSLSVDMAITTMDVSDTAVALPASAQAERRAISIQNLSTTDTLYIGDSLLVQANRNTGTTAGWEIGPNETFNTNIKNTVTIYGITEAGKTVRVKIMEIA